jgi:Flp pilus assembly protein TadD
MRLGDLEKAAHYLERSLALSPVSPAAREMGFLKLQQGKLMEAYLLLRPWSRLRPEDSATRMAAASCAVALGRATEAEALIADLPSDDLRVKVLQGRIFLLKEDGWGALAIVKPMADEAPEELETQVLSVLAAAYLRIEQPDMAFQVLEGKTAQDPELARLLSKALYQRGDLPQALSELEPIATNVQASITPESSDTDRILGAEIATDYGGMLAAADRHQEAVTFLDLATQLDPESGDAWELLAQSLAATGRTDESDEAMETSRAIRQSLGLDVGLSTQVPESDPTGARLQRALRLADEGQPDAALSIIRQEQILVPEDVRPTILEVRMLSQTGRLAEAREVADRAVQSAPDSADAYYVRGTVLLNLGLSGPAEQDLRRAVTMVPQHAAAMNDLAVLLMVRGETDEARLLLRQVLALNPEDPIATENLQALDSPASNDD